MRYALVSQRQANGAKPQSIRELYQFKRKTEAFPLSLLLLEGILKASFIGLHIISALTLNIPFANIACAATAILMFREEIMQFLRGGEYLKPVGTSQFGFAGAISLFMVTALTLAMISAITMINWRTAPRVSKESANRSANVPQLVDGRADGLGSVQMTFYGALWIIGIAQQYQLFNWIDDRNYATHYRVVSNCVDVDPDEMFVRSLRGILLDFYIHDVTWMKVPPEYRQELRQNILERTANRYCRIANPLGVVEAHSSFERIDPNGGPGEFDNVILMKFTCHEGTARFQK